MEFCIRMKKRRYQSAFSLSEMLTVIAVLGVISAIAMPSVSRIYEASTEAKDRRNAQQMASMSAALAALGVAHVIPDSMGGVEATARLLREGIIVPEGIMAGELFSIPALGDEDIDGLDRFLAVKYDSTELSLVFSELPEASDGS